MNIQDHKYDLCAGVGSAFGGMGGADPKSKRDSELVAKFGGGVSGVADSRYALRVRMVGEGSKKGDIFQYGRAMTVECGMYGCAQCKVFEGAWCPLRGVLSYPVKWVQLSADVVYASR